MLGLSMWEDVICKVFSRTTFALRRVAVVALSDENSLRSAKFYVVQSCSWYFNVVLRKGIVFANYVFMYLT